MSVQQFTANDRITINWTGGTSTQLFIYPTDASFAERNFLFRISTATVEAEESVFTSLEGVTRHLMILEGDLELIHEGHYAKHLAPYDQDVFSGGWRTRGVGKVRDFNLMLRKGTTGSLRHHKLEAGGSLSFVATTNHYFIYVASGMVTLSNGNAAAGDLLWVARESDITVHADKPCDLVVIEVSVI